MMIAGQYTYNTTQNILTDATVKAYSTLMRFLTDNAKADTICSVELIGACPEETLKTLETFRRECPNNPDAALLTDYALRAHIMRSNEWMVCEVLSEIIVSGMSMRALNRDACATELPRLIEQLRPATMEPFDYRATAECVLSCVDDIILEEYPQEICQDA